MARSFQKESASTAFLRRTIDHGAGPTARVANDYPHRLPLTVWLQGIYFMTQDKKGVGDEAAPSASPTTPRGACATS